MRRGKSKQLIISIICLTELIVDIYIIKRKIIAHTFICFFQLGNMQR